MKVHNGDAARNAIYNYRFINDACYRAPPHSSLNIAQYCTEDILGCQWMETLLDGQILIVVIMVCRGQKVLTVME